MTSNGIAFMEYLETERHDKTTEAETHRNNVAMELETRRANIARENEQIRSNLAQEGLQRFSNWTERAHLERADFENYRSNVARETENRRSNMAQEDIGRQNSLNGALNALNGAVANLVSLQSVKVGMYDADTRRREQQTNRWYTGIKAAVDVQGVRNNIRSLDLQERRLNLDSWQAHDQSQRSWLLLPSQLEMNNASANERWSQSDLNKSNIFRNRVRNATDVVNAGANLLNSVGQFGKNVTQATKDIVSIGGLN